MTPNDQPRGIAGLTGKSPVGVALTCGIKKDRNFLMMGWTGDNGYHLYDLDSMKTNYQDDELFFGIIRDVGGPTEDKYTNVVEDPNTPYGSYWGIAPLPADAAFRSPGPRPRA